MAINKEPLMKLALDKALHGATRAVSEWTANQAKIETAISDANARLAKAEANRKKFALDANLGNPDAIKEIGSARAEHAAALGDTADLGQALSDAKARLIEAEREAKAARQALHRYQAELLIRERSDDVSPQIDVVAAELARLLGRYEKLGAQIESLDTLPRTMHGGTDHEGVVGARRVRACLPVVFWKLFPGAIHDEMKPEPLATSEARFWNLPQVETTTKAA